MAATYSVQLEAGSTWTFFTAPLMEWDALERVHRNSVTPSECGYQRVEIRLRDCRLRDEGAGLTDQIETLVADLLAQRTVLTAFKLIDEATGLPVEEIGDIQAPAYEDLEITGHRWAADDRSEQLRGVWLFDLTITATQVFPDDDNMVHLSQVYDEDTPPTGLTTKRLTSTVRMKKGTAVTAIAAQLRLARPTGWVRTIGNSSNGFSLSYPRWPLTHEAVCVSEVQLLAGGITTPSGGGFASRIEETQDDPVLGITRTRVTAEQEGSSDPRAEVESVRPTGGVGVVSWDEGKATARATYETVAIATGQPGSPKVAKVRRRYTLLGGGRPMEVIPPTGVAPAKIRQGNPMPPRLQEEITIVGVGVTEIADMPVPAALETPWIEDESARGDGLPRVIEPKLDASQHVSERVVTREYVWSGTGLPTDNEALKAAVTASESA